MVNITCKWNRIVKKEPRLRHRQNWAYINLCQRSQPSMGSPSLLRRVPDTRRCFLLNYKDVSERLQRLWTINHTLTGFSYYTKESQKNLKWSCDKRGGWTWWQPAQWNHPFHLLSAGRTQHTQQWHADMKKDFKDLFGIVNSCSNEQRSVFGKMMGQVMLWEERFHFEWVLCGHQLHPQI